VHLVHDLPDVVGGLRGLRVLAEEYRAHSATLASAEGRVPQGVGEH
jgi:hypothetical protein